MIANRDPANPRPLVLIPVHRAEPNADEAFSIRRCGQILGKHDITFLLPLTLNASAYRSLIPQASVCRVPARWMSTIQQYNRMLVNPSFYCMFHGYTHLLIHEPDALVFRDQLLHWCDQPIDYIGAPWFEGFSNPAIDAPIIGVGNSGFSLIRLRAIKAFLVSTTRWISRKFVLRQILAVLRGQDCQYPLPSLLAMFGSAGSISGAHRVLEDHCDGFISEFSTKGTPLLVIGSVEQALLFAWEVNPRHCFQLANGITPFGVHAWRRYDSSFILDCLATNP
jgi:hypothetical protein